MAFPPEYGYLPAFVFLFLVIDLLLETESLSAILGNLFFWLYWLIYSVAAAAALYFLGTQPALVSLHLPTPLLSLIAIVATTTILQSLTFKIGGKRVLDLSRYLDDYRRKVLTSSAKLATKQKGRRVQRQCRLILDKVSYKAGDPSSENRMKQMYAEVMLSGAQKPETVQREIARIERDCALTGASFGNEVARPVAQTDPEWVANFLAG